MANSELEPLVTADDLQGFQGAPFKPATVQAASQQIRRICGWHIAPTIQETLVLDHDGGPVLYLPSLKVTDVTAVKDHRSGRELSNWHWSGAGMVEGSFPRGFRSVEVTIEHGYAECPADLLPVVASRTQRRVMQESLGGRSVSFSSEGDVAFESTLDLYRLGPRP